MPPARDEFTRAWSLQEEIALHPKSGNYSAVDNHRILSGIAIKQGSAELALGQAAFARERFQRSLELRQAWIKLEPRNVSAQSYASEAELWVAVACGRLGDWTGARNHFKEAIQICTQLIGQHPNAISFRGDLAMIQGEFGAALAASGQDSEAEKILNQSLAYSREVLSRDNADTTQRLVTVGDTEVLAALAQKQRKPAEAERLWRIALEIRTDLARLEPHNVAAQAAFALALAHAGRCDEALKKANDLLKANAGRSPILISLARCFAVCATGAKRAEDQSRALALAHGALTSLVQNGYADPIPIRTEPDFAQILSDPELKKLVDGVEP